MTRYSAIREAAVSMPLSPTRLFVCTACGAVLPVSEEHIGKKCRCGRCGKVSIVDSESPRRQSKQDPSLHKQFSFPCRVCGTVLAARGKDVGRKARCPDCRVLTVVPEAPKPRPKQVPKAMHGQQYGLWGVDEAPSSAELIARQPKFFPVYCRVCNTLMHARPEQVGKKLACPDCGAKTPVQSPPPPDKPKPSVLVPDGEEYQIDPAQASPVRPLPQFTPPPESKKTTRKETTAIRQERAERPQLPRLPIVQGVFRMLLQNPVISWYGLLTIIGLTIGGFMLIAVSMSPLAAIPFFFGAGGSAILGLGATSAMCLAILTESSEGNDRLHNPPGPIFLDWIGNVFYLVTPGVLALAISAPISRLLEQYQLIEQQGPALALSFLFIFPILLLSCLENSFPLAVVSPGIFASLIKRPGHWLLFYVTSTIAVGCGLATAATLATLSPVVSLLVFPTCIAIALLYFRLLGRLAWWLAESLATPEVGES